MPGLAYEIGVFMYRRLAAENEPSSGFSPGISQKLHLISQKLHLEWPGCSGGCIYLRVPSLGFRKNFGLNGYGPHASPPLPPYQHGTPPEQQPPVSTASSLSKASKNGGFRTHFPPFELPTGALGALVLLHAQLPMRDDAARGKVQGAAPGRAQCRCTKNQGQRGAAAAPEGRTWPPTAPTPSCPRGLSCCSTPRSARAQQRHRAKKAQGDAFGAF